MFYKLIPNAGTTLILSDHPVIIAILPKPSRKAIFSYN